MDGGGADMACAGRDLDFLGGGGMTTGGLSDCSRSDDVKVCHWRKVTGNEYTIVNENIMSFLLFLG